MEILKESKTLGKLLIKEVEKPLAKEMIVKNHYSHKWNGAFGVVNIGIFKQEEPDNCLGVAVFGNLMNPKSYKSLSDDLKSQTEILELNRLWIDDCLGANTETILLGACWKILKKEYPHVKMVQSFADGRLGCGTIYKASNFQYFGYSETMFYKDKYDGIIYHKVLLENTKSPITFVALNRKLINGDFTVFKTKTYRYIYPLKKGLTFKIKQKPYPEYDKGIDVFEDSDFKKIMNKRNVARCAILAYVYELEGFEELYDYSIKHDLLEYMIDAIDKNKTFKFQRERKPELAPRFDEIKKIIQDELNSRTM